MQGLEVVHSGMFTTVQDRGRPEHGDHGLGTSGAADRAAHDAANRLVGNEPAAATLEVAAGGLTVRSIGANVVAVTGARVPVTVDGHPEADYAMLKLDDGDVLALGSPSRGLRSYLAVRGGIDVPETHGSRSTDTLTWTGPAPLRDGDRLPVGTLAGELPIEEQIPPPAPIEDPAMLRVRLSRHSEVFSAGSVHALLHQTWTVTPQLDRVGIRLHGPGRLHLARGGTDRPEPTVAGSVQVPPDGNPILFLADHPVVGDHPVIAVVVPADLPVAAQLEPGHRVRFVATLTR
ncbi:biotin-dependent carboxyltransferase family protein [Rhodococcus aetherivorans]|uniref:5-oxoprolinase subunit C family protein n=1 Tax=Rhodococcus aetherivorans TaxID=191292 RepID=UPI001E4831A8|nr:biotin-dependent carboxyltransferase family protein [Rhodococcus aetherivorans]UGQ40689.1 biotin-dependent carboxyltransferase family protein [Rhodococcus aetherivorans]